MKRALLIAAVSAAIAGCGGSATSSNQVVSHPQQAQSLVVEFHHIHNGMTQHQVLDIMGQPIISASHVDNWYTANGWHFKVSYDPEYRVYDASTER